MKIAVIVLAYNEEKYLPLCLQGIKDQTEKPDEVIVVNNNSKDKTVEIAKSFGAKVVNEKKQGMTYARNKGFNSSTADILARVDADTIIKPNWVKRAKKQFESNNIVGLSGPIEFYDFLHTKKFSKKVLSTFQKTLYFRSSKTLLGFDVLMGSNMVVTKKAWNKIKNDVCTNDKDYHEDMDLSIHISKVGKIIFDKDFVAKISARRFLNVSAHPDYLVRFVKSYQHAQEMGVARGKFSLLSSQDNDKY